MNYVTQNYVKILGLPTSVIVCFSYGELESCDLPQAEIKILLFQAEQFYKMTTFSMQNCPWEKSQ